MKLIELEIRNFRVIKSARIEFGDNVMGIIGRNGAGKSTILEAITWAIYGNRAARTGKDQIKSSFAAPAEECRVSLKFEVRGEPYHVIRKLSGRTDRAEVELFHNGRAESVGISDTKDHVGELLGLDLDGFKASFLARQQELNALADFRPAERKEKLAAMLGVERLDRAITRSREDARSLAKEADFIERQLSQKGVLEEYLRANEPELRTLREKLKKSETELAVITEEKKASSEAVRSLRDKKGRHDVVRVELDALKKSLQEMQQRQEGLEQRRKNLLEQKNLLETTNKEIRSLEAVPAEFEKARELKARADSTKSLQEQLRQRKGEYSEIEGRLERLKAEADRDEKSLAEIPAQIGRDVEAAEAGLETVREKYSKARGELLAAENELKKARDQLQSVEKLGPGSVCDRCRRPFGDDYRQIKGHLEKEIAALVEATSKAHGELARLQNTGEKARDEQKRLLGLQQQKNDLDRRAEVRQRQRAELEGSRKQLETKIAVLAKELSQIASESIDEKKFEELRQQVEYLERLKRGRDLAEGRLAELDSVEESLKQSVVNREKLQDEREQKQAELQSLNWNEAELENAEKRFADIEAQFAQKGDERSNFRSRLDVLTKELTLKQEELARLEEMGKELEGRRADRFHLEKLSLLLSDYRTFMISRIRPTLADLSSRLVTEMTGGRYSLIDLDEKYNLQLYDYDQYYEVNRFSGGEKDLASLCLRLAISQMITRAVGMDRSFILLDEVFASQDDERRDLIIGALSNLKERFPQIILVTHIEDIKHRVESLVEVETTGLGWSDVRYNGNN